MKKIDVVTYGVTELSKNESVNMVNGGFWGWLVKKAAQIFVEGVAYDGMKATVNELNTVQEKNPELYAQTVANVNNVAFK